MKPPKERKPGPIHPKVPNRVVIHGRTCVKAPHLVGGGYLHGESDDGPYWVDRWPYCGRCHYVLDKRELNEIEDRRRQAKKPRKRKK